MMSAALASASVQVVEVQSGADKPKTLQAQIEVLLQDVDLIITTGGVSVGEEDHVKSVMTALGVETEFSGVAIKPGKPVSFGRLGDVLWLGLPGNPLSAFVTWQVFGTSILRARTGQSDPHPTRRNVVIKHDVRRKTGRCELRLAKIVGQDGLGRDIVDFDGATHSGHVAGLPLADGLMFLPADTDHLPQGAMVEFQPFDDN